MATFYMFSLAHFQMVSSHHVKDTTLRTNTSYSLDSPLYVGDLYIYTWL